MPDGADLFSQFTDYRLPNDPAAIRPRSGCRAPARLPVPSRRVTMVTARDDREVTVEHLQRYLAEEVVEDYADGLIPRREALRRLGLLGVAAMVAAPMLAACDSDTPPSSAPPGPPPGSAPTGSAPTGSAPAGPPPLATQAITFPGQANRTLMGAWAAAATPKEAVLVIHENHGLTDHI